MTIEHDALGKNKQAVNSKVKGNNNERKAAKLLSGWTGQEFNRTPMSGGLRWLEASRISGDVVAPLNFYFPFSVEVKAYAKIPVQTGELRFNSRVYTLFKQADKDAERADKLPMLMLRTNGMPKNKFWVFFKATDLRNLKPFSIYGTYMGNDDLIEIVGISSEILFSFEYQTFIRDNEL